ncbi:hypothetical protein [uncultured Dokdonia sp.]|uniref:hypothetical protein n=1 Tax=uncultured Dokdonia sp. TaxID=575653 RepID=UPI0026215453|nr:hypothetical protein [uncultured Dokdonia sp.]
MNLHLSFKNRFLFTVVVSLLMWSFLAWDYFHDGVPTHYILHDDNLPGFSNWWGAITIPLVTWGLLYLIYLRTLKEVSKNISASIIYGFIGFLLYAIVSSFFFKAGLETVLMYMAISLMILSFFVPIYRPECLLGYILGMTYMFGSILPLLFGIIFWTLYIIAYKLPRGIVQYINKKKYNSA